jgi:hypothetical protein
MQGIDKLNHKIKEQTMSSKVLIQPKTLTVAAELTENNTVIIHDSKLLKILSSNGITVPPRDGYGKSTIYPTDNPFLFAKAFVEQYFQHGLMQGGYRWMPKAEYTGPEGETEKALRIVMKALDV